MTSLEAERRQSYFRVSRFDVRKETEIAVIIVRGADNPMAIIEDPTLALGKTPVPVPDALKAAMQARQSDINPRQVVIVDEDGLWDSRWGELTPHPDRGYPGR